MNQIYTYSQVREAAIKYFKGDELAGEVFAGKYALQDLLGNYFELTPEDMHRRLAREFARIESKYANPMSEDEIFSLFSDWSVVPQGSPMSGIGNPFQIQSVSNCFVIEPPQDSYGGIFRADQEQAQIMKRRGGVGLDISNIRPKGLTAANAARTTDGIAVFMDRFSNTTREVAQNGRRGALMISISVHHPEIETFINIKRDKKRVTGANISIRVTDEFMNAVKISSDYHQRWPVDSEHPTINRKESAEKIWNMIMEAAWESAEPGVLFWDTIIRESPADCYSSLGYRTSSTNPCVIGSSLIAVADVRNAVRIDVLASENKDVPVYSVNKYGKTEIKMGRNPRKTGDKKEVWKLTLDDGSFVIATPDHRILLKNLEYKKLRDLVEGDSMVPFNSSDLSGVRFVLDNSYNNVTDRLVKSVEFFGFEDVFNITVDDNHNYNVITSNSDDNFVTSSGICVKNCGELPLPPYDSCRLLLLNLFKFVAFPFTKDAFFDYARFKDVSIKAQRLMDDMIDLEIEMVDKIISKIESDPEPDAVKRIELDLWLRIRKVASDARRTGLGITALGDALAALGVKYGSDDSIKYTDVIYKTLAQASYTSSVTMAKERGAFPIWNYNIEKDNPFINRVMDSLGRAFGEDVFEDWKKYGRRNIANLTTSPAGSVSVETQTTSGCEPAFLIDYLRRKKINPSDKQARVDFVDPSGDKWQQYKVYHPGHKMWAEVNGKDPEADLKESPYFGSTTADIDWVKKVDLQAAAQKWVDHSISNTTNIPNDATVETVKKIYMRGWESGCKGLTIYRDGSRTGVLISSNETTNKTRDSEEIHESHAPKRPLSLECDIHRASVKGQKYLVLVGLMNGKPYEIFCGLAEKISAKLPKKGTIDKFPQKSGVSRYDLRVLSEDGVDEDFHTDIVNTFDNENYGAFTRILSTSLRHGVPVHFVVEQLVKDKHSDMWSFSSVIARILSKNYISDGTKTTVKGCPECNSTNLAYQQGCVACLDCGNSKCS